MSPDIKIVEVGARDGLQNEAEAWALEDRIELITQLMDVGIQSLEGGSFVSPKAIPQMQDSDQVWSAFKDKKNVDLSFLVPNEKGFQSALKAGVKSIAVFSATSDTFNQKNIRRSVDESLEQYESIVKQALENKMRVRGYVSTAFGCPYEGAQKPRRLVEVTERLFKMGCEEVSIGDTIGVAHPAQVAEIFQILLKEFPQQAIAAHLHDTRGLAAANIVAALDKGVKIFDSSIGGLGGCPYAKGASGNVATEQVVYLLEGFGLKTGISLDKLLQLCDWIERKLERNLKSLLFNSKPSTYYFFTPS